MLQEKQFSNFEYLKKRLKTCYRCGEQFISDIEKQHFCATCRGRMGSINMTNYKTEAAHGVTVTDIFKDIRR